MFVFLGSLIFNQTEQQIISQLNQLSDPWDGAVGGLGQRGIGVLRADLKQRILKTLMELQSNFCAYCCDYDLIVEAFTVDHVARKRDEDCNVFVFEKKNLVASCYPCNLRLKHISNTVETFDRNYDDCKFDIYHPILDGESINEHFYFFGEYNHCVLPESRQAKKSFRMFKLWQRYPLLQERLERRTRLLTPQKEQELDMIVSRGYTF